MFNPHLEWQGRTWRRVKTFEHAYRHEMNAGRRRPVCDDSKPRPELGRRLAEHPMKSPRKRFE
jgi:hypothetical protein